VPEVVDCHPGRAGQTTANSLKYLGIQEKWQQND
jgi:hypothetical protein